MSDLISSYSELLKKYEALIWMHALKFKRANSGVDVEDLVQVGRLALWKVINRHDGREGFMGFLCLVMRREMRDWVMWARSTIRVPRSVIRRDGWESGLQIVSMDAEVNAEGRPLAEVTAVRDEGGLELAEQEGLMEWLMGAMANLNEKERQVLQGRFFEGKGLKELGEEIGASHQWASKIEQRALGRLRRAAGLLEI